MRTHAEKGGEIIKETFGHIGDGEYEKMAYEVARYHHEKWNGKGYPQGLAGEDIPKDVDTAIRWLTEAADQNNQYAQYLLGKLYLCGRDVPRDREKAILFLQASAAQGNIYVQFFLDHLDSFRDPSAFLAATRLLHRLENLFREDYQKAAGGSPFHIDRKRRRKLAEKKQAQGHKRDDREPVQQTF